MVFYTLHQFSGISQTTDHSCTYRCSLNFYGHFPDTIFPADNSKIICSRIFSCHKVICTAKRRFHNATCCTKDHTGSCSQSQRLIKRVFFQCFYIYLCCTKHTHKFSCCQCHIHITLCAAVIYLRNRTFILLRCTRHNGYTGNLIRRHAQNICIIRFCHRTKHLLWRFCGR